MLEGSIEPYNDGIHQQLYLHYFCPLFYLTSVAVECDGVLNWTLNK